MYIQKFERAEFLAWIAGNVSKRKIASSSGLNIRRGEVAVVTQRDETQGVLLVVQDEEELLDFIAFVGTYVSTYSPFTAFFRVITTADFERVASVPDGDEEIIKHALTGVVICDAIARAGTRRLQDMELAGLLGSEAFALAKGVLGTHFKSVEDLSERWRHAANLIGRGRAQAQPLNGFWGELQYCLFPELSDRGKNHRAKCRGFVQALLHERSVNDAAWTEILQLAPFLVEYRADMEGPREGRARAFTKAAQSVDMQGVGSLGDLCVAFLGVLLAGASIEYAGLIAGLQTAYPAAPLWFGFISGTVSNSDVTTAGQSLGRHLLKQMNEPSELGDSPNCDLSFTELRVVARGRNGLQAIPTRSRDTVCVELIPGVCVDFPREGATSSLDARLPAMVSEARRLVHQLQRVLADGDKEVPAGDLFEPTTSRKKTYRR